MYNNPWRGTGIISKISRLGRAGTEELSVPSGEGGDLQQYKEGTQGEAWGARSSHLESSTSASVTTQLVNNSGGGGRKPAEGTSTAQPGAMQIWHPKS